MTRCRKCVQNVEQLQAHLEIGSSISGRQMVSPEGSPGYAEAAR